jgi:hypothetical protein
MAEFTQNKSIPQSPVPRSEFLRIESAIITLRGERVILDKELASLYNVQTKRLNEQVKRNADRFGEKYAFQLTGGEFAALRSQFATSKPGKGGRRYLPWAFTEYGVVMAATILDSQKAIEASKFIVDVFIEVKRRMGTGESEAFIPAYQRNALLSPLERFSGLGRDIGSRLQTALQHVLDTVIDTRRQTTVREEAQNLISESIQHLKDRLKKQGLENEEIGARVTKLLAEAEKERAIAAKTRAETESLEFATIVRKLRLLLEVQRAIEQDRIDDFLGILRDLGDQETIK